MLHSTTKGNQEEEHKNDLNKLTIKMQHSLDTLQSIQRLLKNNIQQVQPTTTKGEREEDTTTVQLQAKRINELETQCKELRSKLDRKTELLMGKEQQLQWFEQRVENLQLSLTALSTRHEADINGYTTQIKELNDTIRQINEAHIIELKTREEMMSKIQQEQEILLTESNKQQQQDQIVKLMKADLLLYQEKLSEKMLQNKQLEATIERMTRHNEILTNSLNESRKESLERYNKLYKD